MIYQRKNITLPILRLSCLAHLDLYEQSLKRRYRRSKKLLRQKTKNIVPIFIMMY